MNLIDRLERKFPRFGIPDLMRYVILLNIVGLVLYLALPGFYARYLALDMYAVSQGQVWRLFTFVVLPSAAIDGGNKLSSLLLFALWMYVYYNIGISLEQIWGTFRFTLFYCAGVLFVMLATAASYWIMLAVDGFQAQYLGLYLGAHASLSYLNDSMFLAYALMFPNAQFLVYFIVPVRAKWLAAVWLLLDGYSVMTGILKGDYYGVVMLVGALLNVALFLVFGRGKPGVRGVRLQKKRRANYRKRVREATSDGTIHRCAICGRTERDAPNMDFRYCSKCQGSYEYCSEHLFTHEHVYKI